MGLDSSSAAPTTGVCDPQTSVCEDLIPPDWFFRNQKRREMQKRPSGWEDAAEGWIPRHPELLGGFGDPKAELEAPLGLMRGGTTNFCISRSRWKPSTYLVLHRDAWDGKQEQTVPGSPKPPPGAGEKKRLPLFWGLQSPVSKGWQSRELSLTRKRDNHSFLLRAARATQ